MVERAMEDCFSRDLVPAVFCPAMSHLGRRVFPLIVLVAACGGSSQKPQNVTTLPSATASASAVAPAIDLSPVKAPDDLVALIHAPHVSQTADVVSQWAGQTLELEQPLSEMVGERIAKVVDVDGPADMVVTAHDRGERREPEMRLGVALSVKSFDAAKTSLEAEYGVLPIGNGAFEIHKGKKHDGDSDFRVCALAPSTAGGRIVCSKDATSRDAVLPYLTRGLSSMAGIKSDVHVEARPGPFRELVKRERASFIQSGARSMGGGRDLRVLWESVIADLCDGFLDAESATIDANIDAKTGAADLKVTAKGAHALVTRILSAHPERAEAVPATYLRLPQDSDVAFFSHGFDADQIAQPRDELVRAVDAALESENKVQPADRKAFTDALAHTADLFTLPVVYARGVDFAKAIPAVAGLTEASDASKIKAGVEQAAGWDVFGVEGDPTRIQNVFKEWTSALARPALVTAMGSEAPKWKIVPARNAPTGTIHLALSYAHEEWDYSQPGTGKPKKKPAITLTLHTLIVPDGTRAWLVSALDEATAVAKAKQILASQNTLATREGLDALKSARTNAGGFITPRAAGLGLPLTFLFGGAPRYKMANDPLLGISSQSQYTTPLVFMATEGVTGNDKTLTLSLRVPRPALADVLQVGPRIFR
jgi:hypothetical protein